MADLYELGCEGNGCTWPDFCALCTPSWQTKVIFHVCDLDDSEYLGNHTNCNLYFSLRATHSAAVDELVSTTDLLTSMFGRHPITDQMRATLLEAKGDDILIDYTE